MKVANKKNKRIFYIILLVFILLFLISMLPQRPSSDALEKLFNNLKRYDHRITETKYCMLIDYELPIFMRRLWIIDTDSKEIILNSHVSQSYKTGLIYPRKFSNIPGSNLSSIGAFVTGISFNSRFGYSMLIHGLEIGKNDNVRRREIIFHSSYSPYSHGCFMTLPHVNKKVIDLTRNGSFLFVSSEKKKKD